MNKDNRSIYNGYILRESDEYTAALKIVDDLNARLKHFPGGPSAPGYDTVKQRRDDAITSALELKPSPGSAGPTGDTGTAPAITDPRSGADVTTTMSNDDEVTASADPDGIPDPGSMAPPDGSKSPSREPTNLGPTSTRKSRWAGVDRSPVESGTDAPSNPNIHKNFGATSELGGTLADQDFINPRQEPVPQPPAGSSSGKGGPSTLPQNPGVGPTNTTAIQTAQKNARNRTSKIRTGVPPTTSTAVPPTTSTAVPPTTSTVSPAVPPAATKPPGTPPIDYKNPHGPVSRKKSTSPWSSANDTGLSDDDYAAQQAWKNRNQSWARNARNMYDRSGRFAGPSGGDPGRAYRGSQKYRDALTAKWKQNQHSAAARQKHINKKGGTSLGYDMGQLKHAPRNIGTALKTAGSKVFGNNIEPKLDKLGNVKANKAGQTKYHRADPKRPGLLKRVFGSRTKNDSYSAFDDVLNQFGVSDLVNEKKK